MMIIMLVITNTSFKKRKNAVVRWTKFRIIAIQTQMSWMTESREREYTEAKISAEVTYFANWAENWATFWLHKFAEVVTSSAWKRSAARSKYTMAWSMFSCCSYSSPISWINCKIKKVHVLLTQRVSNSKEVIYNTVRNIQAPNKQSSCSPSVQDMQLKGITGIVNMVTKTLQHTLQYLAAMLSLWMSKNIFTAWSKHAIASIEYE